MYVQKEKFNFIFIPFLIIAVSVILGYTFAHWLFIIELKVLSVKDDLLNIWIPFILPWIPLLIWLRPRMKYLNFKYKRAKDPKFGTLFLGAIAITIPTILAQSYLISATGKLTELDNISQIDKHQSTMYYTLKSASIDKEHFGYYYTWKVSGKHNEGLDFDIYIASPILKNDSASKYLLLKEYNNRQQRIYIDGRILPRKIRMPYIPKEKIESITSTGPYNRCSIYLNKVTPNSIYIRTKGYNPMTINNNFSFHTDTTKAWLVKKYSDRISNKLSDPEKERLCKAVVDRSLQNFKNSNLLKFVYLKREGNTGDLGYFYKAIGNSPVYNPAYSVLNPVDEPFESRNGNKLAWLLGTFIIGTILWFLIINAKKVELLDHLAIKNNKYQKKKRNELTEFLSFFIPKEGFYISCIIMDLNILIFLVMLFSGMGFISFQGRDLLDLGANYKPLTVNGEWWRLFSSTFLHGGIMHLVGNMYGLIFVSIFLEPRIGKKRYAVIYVVCGILASINSLWWHDATVSVGASGAIFGLYGLFLALMLQNVYSKEFNKMLLLSTLLYIGINLLYGLTGGIDNAAHLGGLISGFVIGLSIAEQLKDEEEELLIEVESDKKLE